MTNHQMFKQCIDACYSCASACEYCATECLKENDLKMLSFCISLTRECALVCDASARLMAMNGENAILLCQACAQICDYCAAECERNSDVEHCKHCAQECRKCAESCRNMVEQNLYKIEVQI